MFFKIKTRGKKKYFELAHSIRNGGKVVQRSVYVGTTLNLTAQEWGDLLAAAPFEISIRKLFPILERFISRQGLPADTIRGLQDAARLQFRLWKPQSAHAVLGLKAGATVAQVRAAFRRLSLIHHPDQGGDPEVFKRILAARDSLLGSTPTNR